MNEHTPIELAKNGLKPVSGSRFLPEVVSQLQSFATALLPAPDNQIWLLDVLRFIPHPNGLLVEYPGFAYVKNRLADLDVERAVRQAASMALKGRQVRTLFVPTYRGWQRPSDGLFPMHRTWLVGQIAAVVASNAPDASSFFMANQDMEESAELRSEMAADMLGFVIHTGKNGTILTIHAKGAACEHVRTHHQAGVEAAVHRLLGDAITITWSTDPHRPQDWPEEWDNVVDAETAKRVQERGGYAGLVGTAAEIIASNQWALKEKAILSAMQPMPVGTNKRHARISSEYQLNLIMRTNGKHRGQLAKDVVHHLTDSLKIEADIVEINQKTIAKALGNHQSNVSAALKLLEKIDALLLIRDEHGFVRQAAFHPAHVFKGQYGPNGENHKKAIERFYAIKKQQEISKKRASQAPAKVA